MTDGEIVRAQGKKRLGVMAGMIGRLTTERQNRFRSVSPRAGRGETV
jgi:hypothetical protein